MCAREESLVPKMDILKEHRKRPSHAVLADRLGMFDLRGSCGASRDNDTRTAVCNRQAGVGPSGMADTVWLCANEKCLSNKCLGFEAVAKFAASDWEPTVNTCGI